MIITLSINIPTTHFGLYVGLYVSNAQFSMILFPYTSFKKCMAR